MVFTNSKKNSLARQEAITGTIFILPFFIGYILFQFLPFLFSIVVSFTNLKFANSLSGVHFVGISNYIDAFKDSDVRHALLISFSYTIMYVPLVILLGLAFAIFINTKIYLRGIIRTALFLPYISNLVAIAIVWSVILDKDSGPINLALKALGMHNPPTWLVNEHTALATVVLILVG